MWLHTMGLIVTLTLGLFVPPLTAEAEQASRVYRIGWLSAGPPPLEPTALMQAFQQGLRDLGYVEGQNLVMAYRYAEGSAERLRDHAAELVQLQVDCLVVGGISVTRLAKQATSTIPIVMLNASDDPVRQGLITSPTRPGGNITGVIDIAEQLAGKRLELLHEAFPHLARVGHLSDKHAPSGAADLTEVEAAARVLGVHVHPLQVHGPEELDQAFRAAREARAEALIVAHHGFLFSQRARIVQLVDTIRVPVMYTRADFVEIGGLMSYADDPLDRVRRAATFVAKIFQGAQPADLPVEQPTKFNLVINLKAAQALGLTMPPALLFQADKVIK